MKSKNAKLTRNNLLFSRFEKFKSTYVDFGTEIAKKESNKGRVKHFLVIGVAVLVELFLSTSLKGVDGKGIYQSGGANVDWYYFPDFNAYYDFSDEGYWVNNKNKWVFTESVTFDMNKARKVVLKRDNRGLYVYNKKHKEQNLLQLNRLNEFDVKGILLKEVPHVCQQN